MRPGWYGMRLGQYHQKETRTGRNWYRRRPGQDQRRSTAWNCTLDLPALKSRILLVGPRPQTPDPSRP
eukprot:1366793-Rhodomonas_salina.1